MIHYVQGDATEPQGEGYKAIVHVCNDIGGWGRGFVLSLSKKWPHVEADYRNWYQGNSPVDPDLPPYPPFKLGNMRCVKVTPDTWVVNMIAQHGIRADINGIPPIRYNALQDCLNTLLFLGFRSIHIPRIGCGLAGGKWIEIEPIIERALPNTDVYVYDFNAGDASDIPWAK